MIKRLASRLVVSELRRRVRRLLADRELTVITVTGTVGKTSAKLAIGTVLEAAGWRVGFSEDSYNTEVGVPLAIFGLKAPDRLTSPKAWREVFAQMQVASENYPYDAVVLEIAEDERAMMMPWVELLKPQVSVLTGVSPVHMERFTSVEHLRDDAVALASGASRVLYNADVDLVREVMERRKNSLGYGLRHGVVKFGSVVRGRQGKLQAELVLEKRAVTVKTHCIGEHGLYALLAAAAVARELDIPQAKVVKGLQAVTPPLGRMRLLPAVHGARLIDDSYNASPAAVKAALDTLQAFSGRHIAVLGSMNEMGEHAAELHREVAAYAAQSGLHMLVTVGKLAGQYIAPAAVEAGMDRSSVKQFRTPYEAGHYLKKQLIKGDVVLVKGSQNGVFTEETSRILLAPELHPAHELVRQSKAWKRKKRKSFGL